MSVYKPMYPSFWLKIKDLVAITLNAHMTAQHSPQPSWLGMPVLFLGS